MRAGILTALAIAMTVSPSADVSGVPEVFPADRYAKMREKSPFALATPVAEAPAPKAPGFTEGLYLGGHSLVVTRSGVEEPWVSIVAKDKTERFELRGNRPNAQGISIASYEPSPITGKSKVILKKGNEFGEVKQDEAGIAEARARAAVQTETQLQQRMPNGKPLPASTANRAATRSIQIPRPNGQQSPNAGSQPKVQQITPPPPSVTPNNNNANLQPSGQGAPPPPPSRRVRVIPSRP